MRKRPLHKLKMWEEIMEEMGASSHFYALCRMEGWKQHSEMEEMRWVVEPLLQIQTRRVVCCP
jgi:hypothetical protein